MKIGDPVRARILGSRRLVRGVVVEDFMPLDTSAVRSIRVTTGIHSFIVSKASAQVIHKRGERELVLAQVRALKEEVKALTRCRGNKILAR